jgi:hypothetical protein
MSREGRYEGRKEDGIIFVGRVLLKRVGGSLVRFLLG